MRAMSKRRIAVRAVLVLIASLALFAWYALFTGAGVPDKARFAIDLQALRAAAGPEAALPVEARSERIAQTQLPAIGMMVGGGFGKRNIGFYVWQFVYADGSTAMIDAVHSPAMHKANRYDEAGYDLAAWEHQEKAVATARIMAVTHEHHDHIGGFTESSHFAEFGPRLKLTEIQRRQPAMGGIGRTLGGAPTLESGPEGSMHVIGPGLVAISAPGHTPGAQMIYVRMKGGRELLLIGDVVWQNFVLERVGNRPRAITWLMGEDGVAVGHQIRAVLDLEKQSPSVDVVVAHDIPAMEARFASGAVARTLR
jgi:glyoxylase-like metal-dependent hydrolase (beta-lactamase superfamily II)